MATTERVRSLPGVLGLLDAATELRFITDFDPNQPRDSRGRWSDGAGSLIYQSLLKIGKQALAIGKHDDGTITFTAQSDQSITLDAHTVKKFRNTLLGLKMNGHDDGKEWPIGEDRYVSSLSGVAPAPPVQHPHAIITKTKEGEWGTPGADDEEGYLRDEFEVRFPPLNNDDPSWEDIKATAPAFTLTGANADFPFQRVTLLDHAKRMPLNGDGGSVDIYVTEKNKFVINSTAPNTPAWEFDRKSFKKLYEALEDLRFEPGDEGEYRKLGPSEDHSVEVETNLGMFNLRWRGDNSFSIEPWFQDFEVRADAEHGEALYQQLYALGDVFFQNSVSVHSIKGKEGGAMRSTRTRGDIVTGRADWYRIENKGDDSALVYIYDEIGYFNITASDFAKDLNALKAKQITLHLNSPGGEVFDGIAIMNALRNHPATITVRIDGLAASVASVIAMAGDKIYIAPEAQMMIHDANGMAIGNAKDMRTLAALLDKCSDTIAGVYAARAGGEVDTWRALMREESWYNAEEAVAVGLADEIFDSLPGKKGPGVPPAKKPKQALADGEPVGDARGSWDLSVFRYAGRGEAPEPTAVVMPDIPTAAEPDDLLVHAVWSRDLVTTPVDCAAHGVVDQTNDDPWADMTGTLLTSAQAGASTKIVTSDVIDDLLTAFRGQL